ncbi:hypothetical protein GCM10025872_03680 [Barrientosiimonas endolithica]|uniref:Glutamyl-tRNA reductase n=1 Tax=Barrientosiimonas endolithica TaxID=1535208 RepID=A0ABN6YIH5_9MICO|nr:hypothetical protein GCM10025872_03680 [Barrientosiimonas endolithica]
MSTIVIGLSHRSAPIATLERAALDPAGRADLLERLSGSEQLHEVLLLDTCNRVEVYAEAATFHGAVTEIGEALAAATGMPLAELRDNLYVHFSDRAVAHLFSVSAGLDSMAVGEAQILGQLRESLREGRAAGHVGSGLDGLVQQALRVGKRAHSETDIDGVSRSLIERGIGLVEPHLGSLTELRVAVVGAGAMSSLAAHTISRAGCGSLTVVNRTFDAAQRLAGAVGATARDWSELSDVLAESDLVVSCTGAVGHVIDESLLPAATPTPTAETRFQRSDPAAAESERYNRVSGERGPVRRQAFIDLALPRDVALEVGERPGVLLVSSKTSATARAPSTTRSAPCARSSPARSTTTSWRGGPPQSPRPWPCCAPTPPTWWPRSSPGCARARPGSARATPPRCSSPCTASSTSCCTPRPCA